MCSCENVNERGIFFFGDIYILYIIPDLQSSLGSIKVIFVNSSNQEERSESDLFMKYNLLEDWISCNLSINLD